MKMGKSEKGTVRKNFKTAVEIADFYFPKDGPHHVVIMNDNDFKEHNRFKKIKNGSGNRKEN